MRKLSVFIILSCLIPTLALQIVRVNAVASISTYDTNNNPKLVFETGETVRIKAYSTKSPFSIRVEKREPGGTWFYVKDIGPCNSPYVGDREDISEGPDGSEYKLIIDEGTETYAIATLHVVPELPMGTISVLLSSLAALVGLTFKKRMK